MGTSFRWNTFTSGQSTPRFMGESHMFYNECLQELWYYGLQSRLTGHMDDWNGRNKNCWTFQLLQMNTPHCPETSVSDYAVTKELSATSLRGPQKSHNSAKLNFLHYFKQAYWHHNEMSYKIIDSVIKWTLCIVPQTDTRTSLFSLKLRLWIR